MRQEPTHAPINRVAIQMPDGLLLALPAPARHVDVINAICKLGYDMVPGDATQGFMTTLDQFVDRKLAFKIAVSGNQIPFRNNHKELFSEDLW